MEQEKGRTWYLACSADELAPYVVLVGDPGRVDVFAGALSDARVVAQSREFKTITGTHDGIPISVVSTGIGAPSTAIVLEELWQLSVKAVVRAGTGMVVDGHLGAFLLPTGAVRLDGTSRTYLPESFPALADHGLLECYRREAERLGAAHTLGVLASTDGFYSHLFRNSRIDVHTDSERPDTRILETMRAYRVIGMDMETSLLYSLGYYLGIPVASLLLATVDGATREKLEGDQRNAKERDLVALALSGLTRFAVP